MMTTQAKQHYWQVVTDCLVEFHGLPHPAARRKCGELRKEVESRPTAMERNLFYHREAFDVACALAGRQLDRAKRQPEYERILFRGVQPPNEAAG